MLNSSKNDFVGCNVSLPLTEILHEKAKATIQINHRIPKSCYLESMKITQAKHLSFCEVQRRLLFVTHRFKRFLLQIHANGAVVPTFSEIDFHR